MLVSPAAIVRLPVTGVHAVPSKYSSPVPKSVPPVALPSLLLGVNDTSDNEGWDRDTLTTAYSEASLTVTLLTETVGTSLSSPALLLVGTPPVSVPSYLLPLPSSTMEVSAEADLPAPVLVEAVSVKVSVPS